MSYWLYNKNKEGKPVIRANSFPYFHSGIRGRAWVSLICAAIACLMLTQIVAAFFNISTFDGMFKIIATVILILMFAFFYWIFRPKKKGHNQSLKRDE